ncbi:MAG: hypothetical protein HN548_10405 [Opitutae bacterium]|jgi:hypothetical protein|nr:hypothetical protein [Opitutae bacterium]MBT5717173.1 hypothetical protein [Opitutae bacterium]
MARADDEGGSLDMLLDTLCNTFGGIILIALLLALSVNKKSVELYDKLVKTDDNKSELIREREQLKNSLLDLKDENIEILEDLEDDAYSKREEIEEIKDNLDDLNSDSSSLEKLAQREREKLKDMIDMESTIEEERLTMEEELSRLEAIFEHQELSKELKKKPYRKVSLPQQKDTRKKPLPVIVAHGKMYPMISLNIGSVEKNEDGLMWNQTPDKRFQVKVDPGKGVDPMNDDALDLFLSSVRDAPRLVRQDFFLNLFVYSDSENFAIFNKIRDEAVLRKLDYNWIPISELPLILRSDNVPWKVQ